MRIKKYVADSMPAVLKLVKDDLGAKAVVLNTRTIGKTGILGKRGQVEITAAIDDSPKAASRSTRTKGPAPKSGKKAEKPRASRQPLLSRSQHPWEGQVRQNRTRWRAYPPN
jgi:flagellar biosynthesis protein FlhF